MPESNEEAIRNGDLRDAWAYTRENRNRITRLEKHVFNDGYGLERRLEAKIDGEIKDVCTKIDQLKRHLGGNIEEGDNGLYEEMKAERESRERQHEQNQKWQSKMERIVYMGMGAVALLRLFLPGDVFHLGLK